MLQNKKIQDIDDGFFEKFGSLLRHSSLKAAIAESTPLPPLSDEVPSDTFAEKGAEQTNGACSKIAPRFNETDTDSGTETDDATKIELYKSVVELNINELYKEILYEILHNVGCDADIDQLALLNYIQDAFNIANEKHQEMLAEAKSKKPPEILLDVEIIEAKDLLPKDSNGLSDPFVTIYLTSNKTQRYNSSVKMETLNPTWEEHFSLPIHKESTEDALCLEVWDFDPEETVKEKMGKFFDVKGVKGFSKLVKEIAVTASTVKHDDELIGEVHIPIKTIPVSGILMWYNLEKKTKSKRGALKVHLKFSSEKNSKVAIQEHKHLLRILLMHELTNLKIASYCWSGNFCAQADAIITQHAVQSGLHQNIINLLQWTVFSAVYAEYPLSFQLFNDILKTLIKPLQSNLLSEDDNKLFWDGVLKILPSCYIFIKEIRKNTSRDKTVLKIIREILEFLKSLTELTVIESVELFPLDQYRWLPNDTLSLTILQVLECAIVQGATEWFYDIVEGNDMNDKSEEDRLQELIRIIPIIRSDLQRAIEYFDKSFSEIVNISYSQILYKLYEKVLTGYSKYIVIDICKSMKRFQYTDIKSHMTLAEGTELEAPNRKGEPLTMGTTLFELYLILQRFLALGQGLCPVDWQSLTISKFHCWFHGGVSQWLDIAVFKALTRIEKAVELDTLTPIDSNVKHSSSAVDTLAIFYEIKIFWEQLAWPDAEGSFAFVDKIIDDLCRCCTLYADKMAARLDGMYGVSTVFESKFNVTTEWCLAVNNIDYVMHSLKSFAMELGIDKIIKELSEIRSPILAERCKEMLDIAVENSIYRIGRKIKELLEILVNKMMPSISRFLLEGAELLHQDCSSMELVLMYVEENLTTLHNSFSSDNFKGTLKVFWIQLSELLLQLVETNIKKRRQPSFFSNLHECLKIMVQSFRQDNTESRCNETLQRVEYLLKLHGFETTDLIQQFFIERWQEQQKMTESPYGLLSVRAVFCESAIKIEVINARNLIPIDSNGSVNSFIRINLLPEKVFAGTVSPKTQTHKKNLFPLFDETFTIILTPEQRNFENGLIMFNVRYCDMFGMLNHFLAEAFLHFSEVAITSEDIKSLPQIHLKLSRPTKLEGEVIESLEHRQSDKQAKEFLKKQKQKIAATY